jgi:hypothetical protein
VTKTCYDLSAIVSEFTLYTSQQQIRLEAACFTAVVIIRARRRWLQKQGLATTLCDFAEPTVYEPASRETGSCEHGN